ncbi:hypothetical protein AC249_AIPGENE14173 [Exaiptasia diaphana]|nr:hypothetical protein AC249_AIPGENE14173 [Exaiptasia diaphana]
MMRCSLGVLGSNTRASSTKAFLFSLYNTRGYSPVKLPVVRDHEYAIYRYSGYGPTFGGGHDMYISNQASSNTGSYFRVYSYKAPPGCSYGSNTRASSTKAFLFSLYNTRGYSPVKLPVVRDHEYAIYRYSGYGPTFGGGHDMYISNQASSNTGSYFRVYSYKAPPGCSYGNHCSFYTGNSNFKPSNVEVFYETTN